MDQFPWLTAISNSLATQFQVVGRMWDDKFGRADKDRASAERMQKEAGRQNLFASIFSFKTVQEEQKGIKELVLIIVGGLVLVLVLVIILKKKK